MSSSARPELEILDSAATAQPVLECRGARRVFGDPPNEVVALSEVNLTVRSGEFVAIVGKSGSGKSTLLNTLGLMDTPTSGTYCLAGTDTAQLSAAEKAGLRGAEIGFIFQAFHLISSKSVTENVMMAGMYSGESRAGRSAGALEMLNRVGLGHRLHASPTDLSGGERQRVAIARALATRPSLLLADEPTGNLDSSTSREILDLLIDLNYAGMTIVMITHDPSVAAKAQRHVQMIDGVLHG